MRDCFTQNSTRNNSGKIQKTINISTSLTETIGAMCFREKGKVNRTDWSRRPRKTSGRVSPINQEERDDLNIMSINKKKRRRRRRSRWAR